MSRPELDPTPESADDLEAMRDSAQGDFESREPVECCASGRCEVCTPGFVWAVHG